MVYLKPPASHSTKLTGVVVPLEHGLVPDFVFGRTSHPKSLCSRFTLPVPMVLTPDLLNGAPFIPRNMTFLKLHGVDYTGLA